MTAMRSGIGKTVLLPLALALSLPTWATAQVSWRESLEAALAEASEKKLPIFVAMGADLEEVCKEMAQVHYRDEGLIKILQSYVCLISSPSRHKKVKEGDRIVCERYGRVTCEQHIEVEKHVRTGFLHSELATVPQHLVVSPEGKLIEAREFYLSPQALKMFLRRHLNNVRPDLALGENVAAELEQGKIGDHLRQALKSDDPQKREAAVRVLSEFDPELIAREMDTTFATVDSDQKAAILTALAGSHSPIAMPILGKYLNGPDAKLRACAATAIATLKDSQAIIPLRRRVSIEPDPLARAAVIDALAGFAKDDEGAAAAVIQAVGDRDPMVKARAIVALGSLGPSSAADGALLKALDSKDRTLGGAAAWASGKRGLKPALKKIEALAKSFADVRFKVVSDLAMKKIRGEPVDEEFYEQQKFQFCDTQNN